MERVERISQGAADMERVLVREEENWKGEKENRKLKLISLKRKQRMKDLGLDPFAGDLWGTERKREVHRYGSLKARDWNPFPAPPFSAYRILPSIKLDDICETLGTDRC